MIIDGKAVALGHAGAGCERRLSPPDEGSGVGPPRKFVQSQIVIDDFYSISTAIIVIVIDL